MLELSERGHVKSVALETMNRPWTDGPRELLQHAADHLNLGADFDRRMAMISIDNAVELLVKTYLGLPERARQTKGPGRKELESPPSHFRLCWTSWIALRRTK
jgi:hypothetical protein